eukprot:scaffold367_cov202-Alexandrium_tamarense.AAC.5
MKQYEQEKSGLVALLATASHRPTTMRRYMLSCGHADEISPTTDHAHQHRTDLSTTCTAAPLVPLSLSLLRRPHHVVLFCRRGAERGLLRGLPSTFSQPLKKETRKCARKKWRAQTPNPTRETMGFPSDTH